MTSCVALPRKKDCNTYQSGSFRWRLAFWKKLRTNNWTSGCGSVGRVVASDTRGLRFESSHRQNFIHVFTINCVEKTKIKKKGPGMAPFLKKPKKQLNQKCSLNFSFLSGMFTSQILQICLLFAFIFALAAATRRQIWEKESQNSQVCFFISLQKTRKRGSMFLSDNAVQWTPTNYSMITLKINFKWRRK